jgi:exonuclease SbcC
MSHEEFTSTYCTEQKGLEFLSGKKGATEREKFIVRMMGYDRLEEVQELIRGDRKEKRAILTGFEASLGTKEEIEQRLEAENLEVAGIRDRHTDAQKTLQKAEGDFAAVREKMVKLEELRTRFLRERESVQSSQVRLEERGRRVKDLVSTISLTEEELVKVLKPLSASRDLDEAMSLVKRQLFGERERLTAKNEEARIVELAWRENVSRASAERDMAKTQYAQLEKRVTKVGELEGGSDCPTCGQSLGESFDQVRKHFQSEQRALAAKVRDLERAFKEVNIAPESVARIAAEREEIGLKVKQGEAKLQELSLCIQLSISISGLQRQLRRLNEDLALQKRELDELRDSK